MKPYDNPFWGFEQRYKESNNKKRKKRDVSGDALNQPTYETDEEEFEGGGDMNYHLDMKDNNTNPNLEQYETEENEVVMYETDEEEFTPRPSILSGGSRLDTTLAVPAQHQEPSKSRKTSKPTKTVHPRRNNQTQEYSLAFFTLWWSRMVREGAKDALEIKRKEEDSTHEWKLREMMAYNINKKDVPVQRMDMTDCSNTNIHEKMINGWPLTDQNHFCNQDNVSNFTIMGGTRLISREGNLNFGTGVEGLVVPTLICERSQDSRNYSCTAPTGTMTLAPVYYGDPNECTEDGKQ